MEEFISSKLIPGINFTAIDFETANRHRKSACSLGLVVVRDGIIVETKHWLIKPEPFVVDYYNHRVHGISSEMVADKPNFKELWSEVGPYLINERIVAHNASFDLDVLSKILEHYEIDFKVHDHFCTYQASEGFFKGSRSAKLNEVAEYFGLELVHHDALSDAVASAEIAIRLISGVNLEQSQRATVNRLAVPKTPKISPKNDASYNHFSSRAQLEKDLNTLYGFVVGIDADNKITQQEVENLKCWVDSVRHYSSHFPYQIFIDKIEEVVADGIVTSEEAQDITWLCQQYLNTKNSYYDLITTSIQQLSGFLTGIAADGIISPEELIVLENWISENRDLSGTWPFDQVIKVLEKTTLEGAISNSLHDELLCLCDSINSIPGTSDKSNKKLLTSIQSTDQNITIQESTFCITGESKLYSRSQLTATIELYGGFVQNSVSGKLHYLVVCDEKNACWAFASYGRKVEKAMQLKAKGKGPNVIYEEDLYLTLKTMGFSHQICG